MRKLIVLAAILGLALMLGAATAQANLITNGSFEEPVSPSIDPFVTLFSVSTDISGWTVGTGSIDWIGTYWQAAEGSRSLDLNGAAAGSIYQTFATTAGQSYLVEFAMSGNPDGDPTLKTMTASAGGVSADFDFTVTGNKVNMGWEDKSFTFMATDSLTTLIFTSTTALVTGDTSPCGPALDNVRVSAVPLPPTVLLLGSGLVGLWFTRRRQRSQV